MMGSHDHAETTSAEPLPPLLFTIDAQGCLLSLGWPLAQSYQINLPVFVSQPLQRLVREPQGLSQALKGDCDHVTSAGWHWEFPSCQLRGTVQLIALPRTDAAPQWLGTLQVDDIILPPQPTPLNLPQMQSQLTQLMWSIRRTLDLETIWQQTIEGLSAILPTAWGTFCAFSLHDPVATVTATVNLIDPLPDWGPTLSLGQYPGLRAVIQAKQPLLLTSLASTETDASLLKPYLVMLTHHQGEPNGVIILKSSSAEGWQPFDVTLLQEILAQVGTAIAHAHLFRDAQGLADELQAANQRLRQKHRELEEARHQAEEASRLKSEFLANTSHELRTPLNGMIGFLRLILDGMADDPEEQDEFLQEAHKSALHLLNLINDVLDIAKIEAGKMQIEMTPVNLRELFCELENFTRPQAEQKGLALNINLPSTRDELIVNGNYQRLLQVMLNLVGNAIKFTHEGSITIDAEIKLQKTQFQDQEWPGMVKISVADTGIGVSLEKQNRLFQTFSQVDGERTRQYGGTGLGLAISQRLVEAMGGVVQFISMGEELGSTVTFTTLLYQVPVLIE
jgi:signal transduction histidine kinase